MSLKWLMKYLKCRKTCSYPFSWDILHIYKPGCPQAAVFIVLQILWSVCYSSKSSTKFTFRCYTVSIAIWIFFLHLCLMSACFMFVDVWAVSVMAEKVVVIIFAFHNVWVYVHTVHIYGTDRIEISTTPLRGWSMVINYSHAVQWCKTV